MLRRSLLVIFCSVLCFRGSFSSYSSRWVDNYDLFYLFCFLGVVPADFLDFFGEVLKLLLLVQQFLLFVLVEWGNRLGELFEGRVYCYDLLLERFLVGLGWEKVEVLFAQVGGLFDQIGDVLFDSVWGRVTSRWRERVTRWWLCGCWRFVWRRLLLSGCFGGWETGLSYYSFIDKVAYLSLLLFFNEMLGDVSLDYLCLSLWGGMACNYMGI